MEVHPHTHTVPIAIGRKKFTHYLWEFLMLFLAVFCGFLAEYQLEHVIEKQKARQYIVSFYEDLKTDTARYSYLIITYKDKITALATRKECFEDLKRGNKSDSCLANLFENSNFFPDLVYTDRTLQQLKNAGGLRLLNQSDADSILVYDNLLRAYTKTETTSFQEIQTNIRNTIFDLENYESNNRVNKSSEVPVLFSENKTLLNRYFNLLETYAVDSEFNLEGLELIKQYAVILIEYFKTEYHLK